MITTQIENAVCRARVEGEMTIYSAADDLKRLQECLHSANAVEIDLSRVTDIDSAGVQLLIQAKKEGARLGKQVRLVSHSQMVTEIIDLFRLAPVFGDLMIISP